MKSRISVLSILAASAVVVGFAACSKPPAEPPAPVINQDSIDAANRAAAEAAERARRETEAREAAAREAAERARREAEARAAAEREAAMARVRAAFAEKIFFDLDRSTLSAQARTTLDAKLAVLRTNSAVRIRISGHADERGSDSYNVALGQRRAAAAKRYLVDQGIAADRIETVSFGEERPVGTGHDEASWSQNRRAEFEITVGGETIRVP